MNIESLEINLFKASEINDGDIILVKIDQETKEKLKKEEIQYLYNYVKKVTKKENISIYFFPKHVSIEMIKTHVSNIENSKDEIIEKAEEELKEEKTDEKI